MTPAECRDAIAARIESITPESQTSRNDVFRRVDANPSVERHYSLREAGPAQPPPNRIHTTLREQRYELVVAYANTDATGPRASADGRDIVDEVLSLMINVGAIQEAFVDAAYIDPTPDGAELLVSFGVYFDTAG